MRNRLIFRTSDNVSKLISIIITISLEVDANDDGIVQIIVISKYLRLLLGNMAHFQIEMQDILVFIEEFNESLSELVRMIREFIVAQVQGYQMGTVCDRFN